MSATPDETPPPALRTPERHELRGADGGPLRLDFYSAAAEPDEARGSDSRATPAPNRAVILCHGFRGFKEWGFLPFLATRLAEEGLPTVAFNFSSSGVTDAEGRFGEPERFRRGTYGGDLADLAVVTDWLEARLAAGRIHATEAPRAGTRIGLAGHSRGGVIAILRAAKDRRVHAVATLGAPARIGVWPESYFEAWRRGESAEVYDFRTKQSLRLGPELFVDWERNRADYDTAAATAALTSPLLVIHGARDAVVPRAEAETLAGFGRSTATELRMVEGAGHSFQAGDKIRRTPPPLLDAVESVAAWMRRWLAPNEMEDYFFSPGM
ncbi:MAG TPA: alpha/beta fold hydrolase [Candidatus Eisenbacteria bacterium]|nr:alpha/beta fold hydrolase [Candidatus Eisenbacteria bacterium]